MTPWLCGVLLLIRWFPIKTAYSTDGACANEFFKWKGSFDHCYCLFRPNLRGRHGEITRGMLVIDERQDKSNYEPNDNREQVHTLQESNLNPKRYSPETVHQMLSKTIQGVNIVTRTPGNDVLVEMIMQRIFCIKRPNPEDDV